MTLLAYPTSPKALLKGAKHVVVVGSKKNLTNTPFSKTLGRKLHNLVGTLTGEVNPGLTGDTATSLTGADPGRLTVGVLPATVSRHNSPSKADHVRHVVARATGSGKTAIVLVVDSADHTLACVNAVARALPVFDGHSKRSARRVSIWVMTASGDAIEVSDSVRATVTAAIDSAELVDTPPSELTPEAFAARATVILKELPTKVEIKTIVGDKLRDAGLGGIHGVGRCAESAPRMLVASYRPAGTKKQHVALVGKGVTYDTGGLHLKARGFMEGMKCDMGGAAAVFGAFRALVESDFAHDLTLILCLAENAIGPKSYKPDDILTLHSGKTVEINNTDAEGRLLLADGVSWAARELGADIVFDAATLTGAQLISTGQRHAAIVSDDADIEAAVVAAGRDTGDLCHPLVFAPEFFKLEFSSKIADMRNSVSNRSNAQSSCAAQFVYWHMEGAKGSRSRRWCHVDLAGPAFPNGRGTGYGVALLAEAARRVTSA